MKPFWVFCASIIFFACINVMLTASLNISSGRAGIIDLVLPWGVILISSGAFALIAWGWSRGKLRTKNQSDSKQD